MAAGVSAGRGTPDPAHWARLDAVLDGLLDLEPAARPARLVELATDDPELATAARAFLADCDRVEADGFLARPSGESAALLIDHETRGDAPEARLGRRLGAWELTGILGEGGMGVVYAARRADGQYEGDAAVKLMIAVDPGSPLRHRLLAERQILADLDDPRIARLLDGGLSDDGHPYLVMERIDGRTILEHAEVAGLGLEARLDLFTEVCQAVHAAHRRMILHCDLKPSNILVTPRGELKLLDFGVARPLEAAARTPEDRPDSRHQPDPGATAAADTIASRLYTPGYASPEQVAGRVLTPASDVFALGVVLRELIAGERPWDRRLRGDLQRILERAAAADPAARYPSAAELAGDLGRWRRRLPVSATPDTAGYRLRRLVDRHRVTSVALAAVGVAVLVGLGGTLGQARIAARERDQARREALRAQTVSAFLTDLFNVADPNENLGADPTVREILDRGRDRIGALADEPADRAELLAVLAGVYFRLGLFAESRDLYAAELAAERQMHGPDHEVVSDTRIDLGVSLLELGDTDGAAAQIDSCLDFRRRHPRDDPRWLSVPTAAMARIASNRGDGATAARLFAEVLAALDPDDEEQQPQLGRTWTNYGVCLARLGRLAAADSAYARAEGHYARAIPGHHSYFGTLYSNWAVVAQSLGQLERAEDLHRRALVIKRRLRHNQVDIGTSLINLGNLLVEQERATEALPMLEEALAIQRDAFGVTHIYVAAAEINLGLALLQLGDAAAADARFATGEAAIRRLYGDDGPALAVAIKRRAEAARGAGDPQRAAALLQESVAMHRRHLPNSRHRFGEALLELAEVEHELGHPAAASGAAAEAAEVLAETAGSGKALTVRARELAGSGTATR